MASQFSISELTLTEETLRTEINGIRVEVYDDWNIPFRKGSIDEEGVRLAALEDLAAFKLSAIVGRREKKDYIDLYFLFKHLGYGVILSEFKSYDPLLSPKSLLFALSEVKTARENKSPMPDMLVEISWREIIDSMVKASGVYLEIARKN